MAIIFVGLVVVLALFVAFLIPLLAREVPRFAAALPGYLADLQRRDDWLGNAFRHANVSAEIRQFIADLPSKIGESFTAIVGAAGTAFGRVFDVFTVGILCIYFMVALPRLPATIAKLVSRDRRAHVNLLLQRSFDKIGGYVSRNLITSAVCAKQRPWSRCSPCASTTRYRWACGRRRRLDPAGRRLPRCLPAVLVALTEGPPTASRPSCSSSPTSSPRTTSWHRGCTRAPSTSHQRPSSSAPSPAAILAGFAGALLALPIAAAIKVIAVDVVLASRSNPPPEDPANDGPAAPNDS